MKRIIVVVSALAFSACSETPLIGQAEATITQVPPQVNCIQIAVAGGRTVTRSFDVMPGQPSTLNMSGLPIGLVTFTAAAFPLGCKVLANGVPTWVGDPVQATLTAGVVTPVTLILHRNGDANVTVDFQDDDAGTTMMPPPPPDMSMATPAQLIVSPTSADFGTLTVGQSSMPRSFIVANIGQSPSAGAIQISGAAGSFGQNYTKVADTCSGTTLAGGANCTFSFAFTPKSPGVTGIGATVYVMVGMGVITNVSLFGTAVCPNNAMTCSPPTIVPAPTSFDFGNVMVGASGQAAFNFTNTGATTGALAATFTANLGLFGTSEYAIVMDGCTMQSLAPMQTCAVTLQFKPISKAAQSGTLTITGNPGGIINVPINGTGI